MTEDTGGTAARATSSYVMVSVGLAIVPVFYLLVTGGGNYLGAGYQWMATMPVWLSWLRLMALLVSPLAAGIATVWAVITTVRPGISGRTKAWVWVLTGVAGLAGVVALLDIAAGIAMCRMSLA